ncbi:D-alanyl-D-alanine carboxypeptidase family protein [Cetobacterium sp. SF1]|uniref:D-alanyl-D-alanine carboxypeptidase family protein n=1 Tax=Cetobacterium sp. SF1 TaxID=3417654 RepID=UPI003CF3FECF
MKKKIVVGILLLATVAFGKKEEPDYKAYILGDSKGNIYYEYNDETKLPLASVTKMMNILVVFDEIHKGNVHLNDVVTVDWEAVSAGGSSIPMKSGEQFYLVDLIKAAAIKSANNAAYAMAKYVGGGSTEHFVEMMNKKAKELGLEKELEFHTPAGLPTHMTKKPMDMGTAKGIYELSLHAIKYNDYMEIAGIPKTTIKDGEISLKSTNHLLGKNGVFGIKTGYHTRAGFNMSVASTEENITTVTVVLGGKSIKIRDNKILELMEKFHNKYKNKEITNKNISLVTIPVKNGIQSEVSIYPNKNFSSIITEKSDVRIDMDRDSYIEAPVLPGTVVGNYNVYIDNKKVFTDKLIVKDSIEKKNLIQSLKEKFIKN